MPTSRQIFSKVLLFVLLSVSVPAAPVTARPTPDLLTYAELVALYEHENPSELLQNKLQMLLSTPFVNNRSDTRGSQPVRPGSETRAPYLRLAQWNIEYGREFEAIVAAFTDPSKFALLLDRAKYAVGSREREIVLEQAALLREADVIVLNEVDWGMKRTGYRNVVADLAAALQMNYAYGAEFVEVDPVSLGTEGFKEVGEDSRAALAEQISVDTDRYKGLHGTAILSRYPLINVRLIPFRTQGHDWYGAEKKGVSRIESGRRKVSEIAFREKIQREVRRGGRMMLLADIEDPDIPQGRLTIVATHLESRTKPPNRVRQLEELLAVIRDVRNPVVVAGDMNTSAQDSTPTSIQREIKNRLGSKRYWLNEGFKLITGLSWPNSLLLGGLNEYRKQADPTVLDAPLVARNPEARFFDVLKRFRFSDGGAFDFRGERARSIGSGTSPLANSNQRGRKGFVTTYEVERPIAFVGKFKLDWIFVKPPSLTRPYDREQPYIFAPHFGRTLKALNYALEDRLSDHDPIIVDLPLREPPIPAQNQSLR